MINKAFCWAFKNPGFIQTFSSRLRISLLISLRVDKAPKDAHTDVATPVLVVLMTPPFGTARTRSQFGDWPNSAQQQRCKLCIQKVKFNFRCLIHLSFPGASRNCPSSTHLQSEKKHWRRSLGLTEVLQEWHNAWVWLAAQPRQPDTNPHLIKCSCMPCYWQ